MQSGVDYRGVIRSLENFTKEKGVVNYFSEIGYTMELKVKETYVYLTEGSR